MLKPTKEFGCYICRGVMKEKCWMCKFRQPKTESVESTEWKLWKEYVNYLKLTKAKLIKFQLGTSGVESVDKEIIRIWGDWKEQVKPCTAPPKRIVPPEEEATLVMKDLGTRKKITRCPRCDRAFSIHYKEGIKAWDAGCPFCEKKFVIAVD